MRAIVLVVGLIALLFADIWGATTVFNAVFHSGGQVDCFGLRW